MTLILDIGFWLIFLVGLIFILHPVLQSVLDSIRDARFPQHQIEEEARELISFHGRNRALQAAQSELNHLLAGSGEISRSQLRRVRGVQEEVERLLETREI